MIHFYDIKYIFNTVSYTKNIQYILFERKKLKMTTSFYLEHYLDSLDSLPGELRRNFTLMHDMDDKNRNILRDVDAASDEYLRKVGYWNIIPFNYPNDII